MEVLQMIQVADRRSIDIYLFVKAGSKHWGKEEGQMFKSSQQKWKCIWKSQSIGGIGVRCTSE